MLRKNKCYHLILIKSEVNTNNWVHWERRLFIRKVLFLSVFTNGIYSHLNVEGKYTSVHFLDFEHCLLSEYNVVSKDYAKIHLTEALYNTKSACFY